MKISSKLVKVNHEELYEISSRCLKKYEVLFKEYVDFLGQNDREHYEDYIHLSTVYKSIRSYQMFEEAKFVFQEIFESRIDDRLKELQDIENQIEDDYNENLMKVLDEKIKILDINKNT
jgi:hypothetical protein